MGHRMERIPVRDLLRRAGKCGLPAMVHSTGEIILRPLEGPFVRQNHAGNGTGGICNPKAAKLLLKYETMKREREALEERRSEESPPLPPPDGASAVVAQATPQAYQVERVPGRKVRLRAALRRIRSKS